MCKNWDAMAAEAMKRRAEKNTPWPSKPKCSTCGTDKVPMSLHNPNVCDHCLKAAYDVLDNMEK